MNGAECAGLPDISAAIRAFQFRDLRAKPGTDTEGLRGMAMAKDQLGHSSEAMTAHYVGHRKGKPVKPARIEELRKRVGIAETSSA